MGPIGKTYDVIIIGGGIVGLTLAQELVQRRAGQIAIFEKEQKLGQHASGKNSGVVHAGIYYPEKSLKAKYCVRGHRALLDFVDAEKLPVLRCGKVIVATSEENLATLDTLESRARGIGAQVSRISREELRELEPLAGGVGPALWSPSTAVVDSKAILERLKEKLISAGVTFHLDEEFHHGDASQKQIVTAKGTYGYGFLVNASGTQADRIAHGFGTGSEYRILPFKGLYFEATPNDRTNVQRLIYPAPDIRMPFLGVHVTLTVGGKTLFGPTAIPAFGRENYGLVQGLEPVDSIGIGWNLLKMLIANKSGFRSYVHSEMQRYRSSQFLKETKKLMPDLLPQDVGGLYKVGIRAQLLNTKTQQLEMDFVLRKEGQILHVLNAVSPAFTSSFGFAGDLADLVTTNKESL